MVLQHNISSNLYQFQGNLTVQSSEDDPGALVTSITQMTRCSVWDAINSDLRQVFHQQGHSYWENVVLRSPMVDMHVSGRWEESVTNFYRKQFDLHSRAEPLLPSATLNLEYSDSSRFMHRLKLPFLSATYELAIQLRQGSYLPQEIIITFQDHFLTNRTQPILQWMLLDDGLGTGRVRIKSQSHFQIMFTDMAGYVKQVSPHETNRERPVFQPSHPTGLGCGAGGISRPPAPGQPTLVADPGRHERRGSCRAVILPVVLVELKRVRKIHGWIRSESSELYCYCPLSIVRPKVIHPPDLELGERLLRTGSLVHFENVETDRLGERAAFADSNNISEGDVPAREDVDQLVKQIT